MTLTLAHKCPALLVAAPASGQGKTTVTSALARLMTLRGLKVRVFKCGPDFLDPHWLTLASGAPVHQLDLWMTGEVDCAHRLFEAAGVADCEAQHVATRSRRGGRGGRLAGPVHLRQAAVHP